MRMSLSCTILFIYAAAWQNFPGTAPGWRGGGTSRLPAIWNAGKTFQLRRSLQYFHKKWRKGKIGESDVCPVFFSFFSLYLKISGRNRISYYLSFFTFDDWRFLLESIDDSTFGKFSRTFLLSHLSSSLPILTVQRRKIFRSWSFIRTGNWKVCKGSARDVASSESRLIPEEFSPEFFHFDAGLFQDSYRRALEIDYEYLK